MALGRPGFNSEIFTIDLQNEVRHQVIKTDEDSRLISTVFWVPDGKHLGFIVSQYGNKDTYVGTWSIGVDGKEDVWISAETDRPLVSPDGTMIAMTDGRSVSLRYASTNRDHEIYRVQDPRSTIDRLAWSPDSTRLTFYSKVASVSTILVLEVNTGSVVNTNIRVFNDWLAPQLSPDHNLIAFMGSTVVIRDLMRNCQVELPFQDVKDVSWSPDGSMLLVDTFDVTYILKLQEFAAPLFQRTGAVCSRP